MYMYVCMYVCIREICGVFDINDTPKILGNEPIWKHVTCWVIYINFGIRRAQKKLVHHEPSRRRVISKTFLVYLYIYIYIYICTREIYGVFDIKDTPKILGNEPIWKHFTCWVIYINLHHEPSRRRVIPKRFLCSPNILCGLLCRWTDGRCGP